MTTFSAFGADTPFAPSSDHSAMQVAHRYPTRSRSHEALVLWGRRRSDFLFMITLASLSLSLPAFFEAAWRITSSTGLPNLIRDDLDLSVGHLSIPQVSKGSFPGTETWLLPGDDIHSAISRIAPVELNKTGRSPVLPQICQPGNFSVPWTEFQEAAEDPKLAFMFTPYHITTGGGEKYLLTGEIKGGRLAILLRNDLRVMDLDWDVT